MLIESVERIEEIFKKWGEEKAWEIPHFCRWRKNDIFRQGREELDLTLSSWTGQVGRRDHSWEMGCNYYLFLLAPTYERREGLKEFEIIRVPLGRKVVDSICAWHGWKGRKVLAVIAVDWEYKDGKRTRIFHVYQSWRMDKVLRQLREKLSRRNRQIRDIREKIKTLTA